MTSKFSLHNAVTTICILTCIVDSLIRVAQKRKNHMLVLVIYCTYRRTPKPVQRYGLVPSLIGEVCIFLTYSSFNPDSRQEQSKGDRREGDVRLFEKPPFLPRLPPFFSLSHTDHPNTISHFITSIPA